MNAHLNRAATAVIVGLGHTGFSCARYLAKRGWRVAVTDTRETPPALARLLSLDASIEVRLGGLDARLLESALCVVVSPGVSLAEPFFMEARRRGLEIVGDIELFARAADAPVVGITGTNGKSTVTSLVAAMAAAAGRRVLAGGNLGTPALDLLDQPVPDLYVLELSSFQLETTTSLNLTGAVVLNVTEVNGTALATGVYPHHSGVMANREYRPEIDPLKPVDIQSLAAARKGDELSGSASRLFGT